MATDWRFIMRIGSCAQLTEIKALAEMGFDYIETNFSRIVRLTDEEFEEVKKDVLESGIKIEACNGFFHTKFELYAFDPETGDGTDEFANIEKSVYDYVKLGYERVSQLGTEVVVIGSSHARSIPEGMKPEVAEKQFSRILEICADLAAEYGIKVTVEPLNPLETNFVNTLADSLDLIDKIDHPNLLAMNDFYHSLMQNEPLASLDRAGKRLVHIHICRADRFNCTLADKDDMLPLVQYLADMGYDARLSFEGKTEGDRLEAIRNTYELMKLFRDVKPSK